MSSLRHISLPSARRVSFFLSVSPPPPHVHDVAFCHTARRALSQNGSQQYSVCRAPRRRPFLSPRMPTQMPSPDDPESALEKTRAADDASSSRGPPEPSFTFKLDLQNRQLSINGHVAKFDTFSDNPSEPWFEAKAIHAALGCKNVTHSLERLHPDDKMSFGDLINTKGAPLGVVTLDVTTPGYHEAKAIRINESGIYTMVLGSKKKEARDFQRWVTKEVLPSIRERGYYASKQTASDVSGDTAEQLCEQRSQQWNRDGELQKASQEHHEQRVRPRHMPALVCVSRLFFSSSPLSAHA